MPQLAALCKEHGMPTAGLTDTNNMFGALELSLALRSSGVQPVVGCQIAIGRPDGEGRNGIAQQPDQLVLLVQNETGYTNLLSLASKAHLATESNEHPHMDMADLKAASDGLIALTAGPAGTIGRLLSAGQNDAAEAALVDLAETFPGRLYVEVMRHKPR